MKVNMTSKRVIDKLTIDVHLSKRDIGKLIETGVFTYPDTFNETDYSIRLVIDDDKEKEE